MPQIFFDYQSKIPPVWCTYCGDYGVLTALIYTFAGLDLDPSKIAVVSGIGCSGRLPAYTKTRGLHTVHGRAVPVAEGVKAARPEWAVLAVGGDGDILGIGGGHLIHAARRNLPITTIMIDNAIYGMTKGQASPTTGREETTRSTPYGNPERPINPVLLAIASGATFVARGFAGKAEELIDILGRAIRHNGFSFIHLFSPCVTFNPKESYRFFSEKVVMLETPPGDKGEAMRLAVDEERLYLGRFYEEEAPTCLDNLQASSEEAGEKRMERLIDPFR
ncbi:MAG: thiamine pyrophosphate-dependent enzyme [Thermodesulfobacteriota bacterium]